MVVSLRQRACLGRGRARPLGPPRSVSIGGGRVASVRPPPRRSVLDALEALVVIRAGAGSARHDLRTPSSARAARSGSKGLPGSNRECCGV
jgi:hypothetical protein